MKHRGSFYSVWGGLFSVIMVVHVMCELFSAAAYPSSLGRHGGARVESNVIFQLESSVLLVHGAVAMIHFKNSILQLKHYLSVMGTGILSIAKLKLSITLIKSTALNAHTHTRSYKRTASVSIVRRWHLYFNSGGLTKQKALESRASGEILSFTSRTWFVFLMAAYSRLSTCLLCVRHSGCFIYSMSSCSRAY